MMSNKPNLVLIFGGKSGEHKVSLMSARSVLNSIDYEKYEVFQVGITEEGHWYQAANALDAFESRQFDHLNEAIILTRKEKSYLFKLIDGQLVEITPIDIIFPVLHGTFGEDGTIQGLFEINNCAYVGAGVLASSVAMDKALCKDILSNANIPVLPHSVYSRKEIEDNLPRVIEAIESHLNYPIFVKPANLGSSVGISKARNRSQLQASLQLASRYDRRILAEQGIEAREIEVSILGNENPICSEPGEIIPGDEFYTYADKYLSGDPNIAIPAPLSEKDTAKIRCWAIEAFRAIDGAGLARIDFLLDKNNGKIWLSEINTMPGFTQISMYSKMLQHSGISYSDLIDQLIQLGLERKAEQDRTIRKFEGDHGN
jgi:D-alanine-D-alanine ligase